MKIKRELNRLEEIIEFGMYNTNPDKKVALAIVKKLKTANKKLTPKQAEAIAQREKRLAEAKKKS